MGVFVVIIELTRRPFISFGFANQVGLGTTTYYVRNFKHLKIKESRKRGL
jgi:hypothetical protein